LNLFAEVKEIVKEDECGRCIWYPNMKIEE
jgi:hypothetical protein